MSLYFWEPLYVVIRWSHTLSSPDSLADCLPDKQFYRPSNPASLEYWTTKTVQHLLVTEFSCCSVMTLVSSLSACYPSLQSDSSWISQPPLLSDSVRVTHQSILSLIDFLWRASSFSNSHTSFTTFYLADYQKTLKCNLSIWQNYKRNSGP